MRNRPDTLEQTLDSFSEDCSSPNSPADSFSTLEIFPKGAQDPGLPISTLVNFISSDLIGGKTMEVIWAPIGGNIVGASVLKQVF